MATMQDLDRIALALPEVTKEVSDDGRPSYVVHGKSWFCFHRSPRRDAVDEKTGKRLTDVLVFRVDGEDLKELMLNDERGIFFTTPHWNGYRAVLLRERHLGQLSRRELEEVITDAWVARAPNRLAKDYLGEP